MQRENIDFEKTFAFIIKFINYKIIFIIIIVFDLKLN